MKENTPQRRRFPVFIFYLIFVAAIVGFFIYISTQTKQATYVTYNDYSAFVEKGEIFEATITQNVEAPTGVIQFVLKSDKTNLLAVVVPDVQAEGAKLGEAGVVFIYKDVPQENLFLTTYLPILLVAVLVFVFFVIQNARMNAAAGGMQQANAFTKNRAEKSDPKKNKIRFKDVAGLQEEKEDLEEIVDFLKEPSKYTDMGARIPKGVLLSGPPGTGKTLLAKAVAGEAGVPFFTISGSDFVELYVGVGASRVRDLFGDAKANAPCIIFIDEIDAVARHRGAGLGGGHDEREQTLNQILVEMDGFSVNQGIIVMAATNRVDILDPAILRPGRFDRKVNVGRPDVKGREEILHVHARNKKLGDDVDLRRVAQTSAGFTGADLENLLNEAAILAAKSGRPYISQSDIDRSFIKVGIGQEKKSKLISEKDKRITAVHEMGHAILFEALPDVGPVHTVSIIPTGSDAAGYTMPLPESDSAHLTKSRMLQDIMVSMGGRIAEDLEFHDVTTGASQDIKQATSVARNMVMKYGMSEKIGFLNYEQGEDQVFMGRDLGHTKTYGTGVVNEIEDEIRRIVNECYDKAKAILVEKQDVLKRGVEVLLEKEKIG